MTFQPSTYAVTHVVTDDDTAAAVASGDLAVLATPRLLAWLEEASCGAVGLDAANTSVSARVELEHLAPSPVGAEVTATATVVHRDGRLIRFQVVAHDARGTVLAKGEAQRIVVDRERFLSQVPEPGVGD
ncbi:thioesterase family protein [Aeromicrobium sp.]|uniref:thioesterase family protein n=1 Tax=Aeromicrobium sp. TaxID=1871063 RepID=UPI003D6C68E2